MNLLRLGQFCGVPVLDDTQRLFTIGTGRKEKMYAGGGEKISKKIKDEENIRKVSVYHIRGEDLVIC